MQDDQHRGAAISKRPNGLERGVLMQGVEHRGGLIEQQGLPVLPRP